MGQPIVGRPVRNSNYLSPKPENRIFPAGWSENKWAGFPGADRARPNYGILDLFTFVADRPQKFSTTSNIKKYLFDGEQMKNWRNAHCFIIGR